MNSSNSSKPTPKYIVIDGIDGGGKGTLIAGLQKVFIPFGTVPLDAKEEDFGKYFHYTREPGGTDVGEKIRALLLNDFMYPFSEMCLFSAQRYEVRKVVEENLSKGVNVLSDRSECATFAYQIRGRGLEHLEKLFWEMNKHLTPFPTLYIFLDLDPKVAASRMKRRESDQPGDRFDTENIVFFEKVRKGFLDFQQKVDVPCKYVNAEQPAEKLLADVTLIISDHIGLSA